MQEIDQPNLESNFSRTENHASKKRGYYRCSTSKGCSAKKQVERCKTDSSMLIITYTSTHNHPGPNNLSVPINHKQDHQDDQEKTNPTPGLIVTDPQPTTPKQEQEAEDHFQYSQSPFNSSTQEDHINIIVNNQEDHNPFQENMGPHSVLCTEDPKPFSDHDNVDLSKLMKSEENDFYDELEELPTSSFFTAFMRSSSFWEERVIVNPS